MKGLVILMSELYIITSKENSIQLDNMIEIFAKNTKAIYINNPLNIPDLFNKKILFALELNNVGFCPTVLNIISVLYDRGDLSLCGSIGVLLVHSKNDLYTKSASCNVIFLANKIGCDFIGHPVVEATGDLNNLLTWQKTLNLPLEEICFEHCRILSQRLINDLPPKYYKPNVLILHASHRNTSNTLMLWNMIKQNISGCQVEELNVENGTINDCSGCSFKTCLHYSKQNSCFYGGFMVNEIFPAIEKADAVIFICPNYNDAISANLTAVVNRTTALYRKMSFYDKYFFSIVVSGNSGSDSVAKQLIGALNVNKGFRLPSNSIVMATANDPGSIENVFDIKNTAKSFAQNLLKQIKK